MPSSGDDNPKKTRRVSFAGPNSSPSSTHPNSHPNPPPGPPGNIASDYNNQSLPPSLRRTATSSAPASGPSRATKTSSIAFPAGVATHTVTNTPHGLIIDGVLRPRGTAAHTDTNDQPAVPTYPYNAPFPSQPAMSTMSTVAAGVMADPNAVHYQPPVPDTTYGPFQYTYVPRTDQPQDFAYPPGVPAAGPPFFAPGAVPYHQAHTGMATAPIAIVPPGAQGPPMAVPSMAVPPMAVPPVNVQPGVVPPMAYPPGTAVPGMYHPTPPVTPPGTYFVPGAHGGYELGKTKTEIDALNQAYALKNQMNEPQDIKPADDDISRMYWARELDGQWISRSRYSLDSTGNFRWYVTDSGIFYAVILPE